ncbi:MAG: HAMP domain-containing histidine kinase, partial [Myxococcota bacterium]|nr:HAMP domain-containing histidine kinase [Myxococcota bacterium]
MIGAARLRTVLATALCCGGGALLLPWTFRALLQVPADLMPVLIAGYLGAALLMTLAVAVTAWVALWPATPYLGLGPADEEPRGAEPREARAALLAFPFRVATAGALSGELAVGAGWLALTVSGQPTSLVLGLSLCTAVLVGLAWLLLYAIAQRAISLHLQRLRDAGPPPGHLLTGTSLRGRLAFTLVVAVAAGVIPMAVLGTTQLEHAALEAERAHGERILHWLRLSTRGLPARSAEQLVETVPLAHGFMVPAAGEPERGGVLRLPGGKSYRLPPSPKEDRPLLVVLAAVVLLVLLVPLALQAGGIVLQDVRTLIAQVRSYTDAQPRTRSSTERVVSAEAMLVEDALDRLMDRMRRLHVDSYLAIERSIDARRAKSQFLASMSHDLRSPLSSVLGFAELLSNGYEGAIPDAARRRLQRVHKTGRHLLRLLSEILDTAKVESQTIELHLRRCAPAELLAQAILDARRGRAHEDFPVALEISPGLRTVQVDPLRFPQALAYLIGHVLDSAQGEPGQQRLRVSAREGQSDHGPTFEVEV